MDITRELGCADLDQAFAFDARTSRKTLALELARPDQYLWMGLFDKGDGTLRGVHRGLRFGGYLLLKGLIVAPDRRGSTGALRLALAMIERARVNNWSGVAAWNEPSMPERFIADRLRLASVGTLVHRYLLKLDSENVSSENLALRAHKLSGTLEIDYSGTPLLRNVFTPESTQVDWVLDANRIVLSGTPCSSVSELPELLKIIQPLARRIGVASLEVHIPAADILSGAAMMSVGMRRCSRAPMQIAIRRFENIGNDAPHPGAIRGNRECPEKQRLTFGASV